jgi:hypothetical protein
MNSPSIKACKNLPPWNEGFAINGHQAALDASLIYLKISSIFWDSFFYDFLHIKEIVSRHYALLEWVLGERPEELRVAGAEFFHVIFKF